ncbi:MAG: UPF0158 family protein [Polyangiaceae bacterium]|nr:UPF0158 family protein [Polyangiaceae bacterium]
MTDVTQIFQDVPVDWEALEDAFENNAPEVHSYLHVDTGEVLRVVDGIADPEMHSRIATDPKYTRVEPVSSREQYRWMERFITMVDDEEVRSRLSHAIDGKGAFRRFKDVLMSFADERERWFVFRSERLRVFMEAWLTTHGLKSVEREAVPKDEVASPEQPNPPEAPVITQEQLGGRRGRGGDVLRRQLSDVIETMSGRDLEKVLAFAEFLKARRAARHHSHRSDSSHIPRPEPATDTEPQADHDADDKDPPSQRRPAEVRRV